MSLQLNDGSVDTEDGSGGFAGRMLINRDLGVEAPIRLLVRADPSVNRVATSKAPASRTTMPISSPSCVLKATLYKPDCKDMTNFRLSAEA